MKNSAQKTAFVLMLMGFTFNSFAGDPATSPAQSNPPDEITSLLAPLNDKGITFPTNYTGEVLGSLSGGYKQGAIYEGLLNVGVQVDLEKFMGWKGATILVSGLYPHGLSLTDRYVHDYNRLSNIDANHDARLYQLWFQQNLFDDKFSFRIGQILADTDFYISSNSALFINSAFGVIPVVSQNINEPAFPIAAPGMRFAYTPNDAFYAQCGVFVTDVGNPNTNNRFGTRFFQGSSGVMMVGEIGYTLNSPPKDSPDKDGKQQITTTRPLSGTYKLGAFYNTKEFDDVNGVTRHDGDHAVYFIVDQEVWHKPGDPDQGLRLFGRVGGAPDDRNAVSFYCDGGLNYVGLIPSREKDIFGIAIGYTKISDSLLDGNGLPVAAHHDTIIEATYQAQVNTWLTLQPDIQYIINPGGITQLPNALVAGLRFSITF